MQHSRLQKVLNESSILTYLELAERETTTTKTFLESKKIPRNAKCTIHTKNDAIREDILRVAKVSII